MWRTLLSSCLNLLFPISCLGCRKNGSYLCTDCLKDLPFLTEHHCPECKNRITPHGAYCFDHVQKHALSGIFAALPYKHPLVQESIHVFKYRFVPDLAEPLSKCLLRAIHSHDLPLPDLILPVPLHTLRLRYRGFNQSELIAHHLANHLLPNHIIPSDNNLLIRTRFTLPQQQTKTGEERRQNLTNAFAVRPGYEKQLQGKSVWLIDDVATTGTTLEECAKALKKAGAKQIFGVVIAR